MCSGVADAWVTRSWTQLCHHRPDSAGPAADALSVGFGSGTPGPNSCPCPLVRSTWGQVEGPRTGPAAGRLTAAAAHRWLGGRPPRVCSAAAPRTADQPLGAPARPRVQDHTGPSSRFSTHAAVGVWRKAVAFSAGSLEPPLIFTPSVFQKASKAAFGHRHRPKRKERKK